MISWEEITWLFHTRVGRCMHCGSTFRLACHHRVFRSAREETEDMNVEIQNLVYLCQHCHDRIHGGDVALREKYEKSYTCPDTFRNIPYTSSHKGDVPW